MDTQDFISREEESQTSYYGVQYERDPKLRIQAIAIHGLACKACGFDFEKAYREHGMGYIHVHHTLPISEFGESKLVNPETDMVTLCANCHAVVHRKRGSTLSLEELKRIVARQEKSTV